MKKRILALILCVLTMFALCGCKMSADITIKKDGSAKITSTVLMEKDTLDKMGVTSEQMKESGMELVKVDGVKYYKQSATEEISKSQINEEYGNMTSKFCCFDASNAEESMSADKDFDADQVGMSEEELKALEESMTFDMSITFPYKVTKTNGKLSNNDKTVTWDLLKMEDKDYCYAYTTEYSDGKAPVIKGVKEAATYDKTVTVKYSDNSAIQSATLDGKKIKSGKKVTKNGEHTVTVTDVFGNTSTVKFTVKK